MVPATAGSIGIVATTGMPSTSVTSRSDSARPGSTTRITPSNHPPAARRLLSAT